jgi:hypothetical protein
MTEMSNICNCKCLTEMRDKVSKLKPEVPVSNIRKRISHLTKKKIIIIMSAYITRASRLSS